MEDLFRDFWWLIFPLAWIVGGGFSSFLNYRRQKHALDLIRSYADRGQEPPEAVMKMIGKPLDGTGMWSEDRETGPRTPTNYWSLFGLFAALCAGFLGANYFTDMDGDSGAFVIVAFTMGAVAVWALISAMTTRRDRS